MHPGSDRRRLLQGPTPAVRPHDHQASWGRVTQPGDRPLLLGNRSKTYLSVPQSACAFMPLPSLPGHFMLSVNTY